MTVSACQGSKALWNGIRWGIGHSIGLILVALVLWLVESDVKSSSTGFSKYASYFSGVFMILLGLYFVRDILQNDKSGLGFSAVATSAEFELSTNVTHNHLHEPENALDDEFKIEEQSDPLHRDETAKLEKVSWRQTGASLFAGIIGGIAGPGGLLAIVPASYYSTKFEAISYILLFILSSTAMMGIVAYVYGRFTSRWVTNSLNRQQQETKLKLISAIISVLVGLVWILLTALDVMKLD
jgi:ABC-type nickel/cobalt efflux system permease component RcnA